MKYFAQAFLKFVPILLVVLMLHALVLWQVLQLAPAQTLAPPPKPVMVSLITPLPLAVAPSPPLLVKKAPLPFTTTSVEKPKKIQKPKPVKKVKRIKKVKKPKKTKRRKKSVVKKFKPRKTVVTSTKQETLPKPLPKPLPIAKSPEIINPNPVAKSTHATQPSPRKQSNTRKPNTHQTGRAITPPSYQATYLHNPPPSYPRISKRRGEEGTVRLHVKVSPLGQATLVQIKKSSGFKRLDKAARRTVTHWRFVPAQQAGKPISAWVIVPIVFKLN